MAQTKKSFLRNKPMEGVGKRVATNLIGSATCVGAACLDGKIKEKVTDPAKQKYLKAIGPGLVLLSLASDIFIENEYVTSATRGLGNYGSLKSAKDFIPEETKAKIGLAGLGASEGTTVIDGTPDWNKLAAEAEMNGTEAASRELPADFEDEINGAGAERPESTPEMAMAAMV